LPQLAGEQTSSEPAIYKLLAKGTSMSEQKTSYMVELDKWSNENVIFPLSLATTNGNEQSVAAAKDAAKKAIPAKVLESYRNGQAAGPSKFTQRK